MNITIQNLLLIACYTLHVTNCPLQIKVGVQDPDVAVNSVRSNNCYCLTFLGSVEWLTRSVLAISISMDGDCARAVRWSMTYWTATPASVLWNARLRWTQVTTAALASVTNLSGCCGKVIYSSSSRSRQPSDNIGNNKNRINSLHKRIR